MKVMPPPWVTGRAVSSTGIILSPLRTGAVRQVRPAL